MDDPYLLQLFVRSELHGTVGHDTEAVDPVPSHKTSEPFFLPHPDKTSPDPLILAIRRSRLHLSSSGLR